MDHLAVALGFRVDVDRDQLVRAVAESLDAQGPDVDVILLSLDQLRHVRRVAGLVGPGDKRGASEDGGCNNG
jgi:methylmalonyl-CoA mutase cobalamin-binding subunit